MPVDPTLIVGEILGRRAVGGADPSATNYECPFIHQRCTKRSTNLPDEPYPVCSIWRGASHASEPANDLIFVCPKRFYAVNFLKDVIDHCWPGDPPQNPHIAPEVKMAGFGNVDFVIADIADDGEIGQFLSVELQAIDITGSVFPAYHALRSGTDLGTRPSYGLNWRNVYKRYVTQLIDKGYFHHHWKSKIVAVIPEQVYRYIRTSADFMVSADVRSPEVNVIFMSYRLEADPNRPGEYLPKLATVEGTSHSSLKDAVMYKQAPARNAFTARIKHSLVRAVKLADLIATGTIPADSETADES